MSALQIIFGGILLWITAGAIVGRRLYGHLRYRHGPDELTRSDQSAVEGWTIAGTIAWPITLLWLYGLVIWHGSAPTPTVVGVERKARQQMKVKAEATAARQALEVHKAAERRALTPGIDAYLEPEGLDSDCSWCNGQPE